MADISMCRDKACPSRTKCYRFVATPSQFLQSYGSFGRESDAQKCSHYWPVDKGEVRSLDRVHKD